MDEAADEIERLRLGGAELEAATMSETNERPVGSDGYVGEPAAWAVIDGTKALVGYQSCNRDKAEAWAREYGFLGVVPLFRRPQAPVRLPREPADLEISEANGYAAAIAVFKRALAEAGVEWLEQP